VTVDSSPSTYLHALLGDHEASGSRSKTTEPREQERRSAGVP
jgi:hypothetical protein